MESDQPNIENEKEPQQKLHYTGPPSEGIKISAIEAAIAAGMAPSTSRVAQNEFAHESEMKLPDWTDPPTGAVPRILLSEDEDDDEFMKMPAPIWREKGADWHNGQDLGLDFISDREEHSFVADGIRSMASMPEDINFDEIDLLAVPTERYREASQAASDTRFDDGIEFPDFADIGQDVPGGYAETGANGSYLPPPHFDYVEDDVAEDRATSDQNGGTYPAEDVFVEAALPAGQDFEQEDPFAKLEEDFFPFKKFKKKKPQASEAALNNHVDRAPHSPAGKKPENQNPEPKHFNQPRAGANKTSSSLRSPKRQQAYPVSEEVESPTEKVVKRNPLIATLTGLILGGIVIGCFEAGVQASLALIVILAVLAAGELLRSMKYAGHRPAAVLALASTLGLVFGAYFRHLEAIVLVLALTIICGLIWYMFSSEGEKPTVDLGITLLVVAWIGGLASFGALLLSPATFPHRTGVAFFASAVILAAANDVGAYLVGALFGKHLLAPKISPHKSLEGFLGGTALTFVFAAFVVASIHPLDMGKALVFAGFVVFLAPLGDFAESLIKRDLNVKDMGSILPAHGGILDRVDGILFVLPAIYYLVEAFHLV